MSGIGPPVARRSSLIRRERFERAGRPTGPAIESPAMGTLESFNPATGELLGTVATIGPDEVQAVVDDVAEVQPFWAQLTLAGRRVEGLERAHRG